MDIKNLKKQAQKELNLIDKIEELKSFEEKYLGKKGEITKILRSIKELPEKERRKIGKEANQIKDDLILKIKKKREELQMKKIEEEEKKEWFDISLPGKKIEKGHLHPLSQVQEEVERIFTSFGFWVVEGPEIEDEWYNFDALNIPKEHPARDMWDTFWLKENSKEKKLLLRTHTSPVQIHFMEKEKPPLRVISPGRIFRYEATDASHEINFYQVEGLMIDEDINVANFSYIIHEFLKSFFGKESKMRLRPSYFPFTEPSFEIDVSCTICKGRGCSACSNRGWIEIAGAGMVHPNVLSAVNINPKRWQGFAFGMGLDRLAMMKYKINDIRLFYSSDLRFLKQF